MSLHKYLKPSKDCQKSHSNPLLPDPTEENSESGREIVVAANKQVDAVLSGNTRKRSSRYHRYDPEAKAKIARYAAENGNKAAATKFSSVLGHNLHESTIRNFNIAYYDKLKCTRDPDKITELEGRKCGRPTLLTKEMESALKNYIHKLRLNGGIVNRMIVISAAHGIVEHFDKSLLTKYGRVWAQSFMSRVGFVKCKGTKAAKKLPDDFPSVKLQFLEKIKNIVSSHSIPDQLIFNWDQTGVKLVPDSEWTMAEQGSRQVPIRGLDDKREITVLLTVTLSGRLLPPQPLYPGKTARCHPKQTFPNSWDVYHTPNHWSNEESMLHFVQEIIIPYVKATRERLALSPTQEALAIFDVFAAHRVESLRNLLGEANIKFVYVPASCTSELQPLDRSFNNPYKTVLKQCFIDWYGAKVKDAMDKGEEVNVSLTTSIIKELHAEWLIKTHSEMEGKKELIMSGFEQSGITEYVCSCPFTDR